MAAVQTTGFDCGACAGAGGTPDASAPSFISRRFALCVPRRMLLWPLAAALPPHIGALLGRGVYTGVIQQSGGGLQACCLALLPHKHQELTSAASVHHTASAAQLHTHARTVLRLIPTLCQ